MSEVQVSVPQQISIITAPSEEDNSLTAPSGGETSCTAPTGGDNSVIDPSNQSRNQRLRKTNFFLSVTKRESNNVLSFLLPSNHRDIFLLRCLVLKVPWAGGYGKVTKAWDETAEMLRDQKAPDGSKVFDGSLSAKVIRDRFKVLLKWIKHYQSASASKSGVDDELPPGEVMRLLEEVLELFTDFEVNKDETSTAKAAARKRAREQAAAIREASLGGRTRESLNEDDESRKSKSSRVSTFDLTGMIDLATAHLESTPKKVEMMERKLILSEEKLKLETARFALESEERRQGIEERKLRMQEEQKRNEQNFAMIQAQMNLQKEMMEMMMKRNQN